MRDAFKALQPWRRRLLTAATGMTLLTLTGWSSMEYAIGIQAPPLERKLTDEIAIQKPANAFQRPVLHGAPLPGNGAVCFWKLFGKISAAPDQNQEAHFSQRYPALAASLSKDHDEVRVKNQILPKPEITRRYAPVFEELKRINAHESFHADYAFSYEQPIPNLVTLQQVADLMISRAVEKCRRHDPQGAQDFIDILRLAQDSQKRGTLIEWVVGVSLRRHAIDNLSRELSADWLKPEAMTELLRQIHALEATDIGPQISLANEHLTRAKEMLKLAYAPPQERLRLIDEHNGESIAYQTKILVTAAIMKPLAIQTLSTYLSQYDENRRIFAQPPLQRSDNWDRREHQREEAWQKNQPLQPLDAIYKMTFEGIFKRDLNQTMMIRALELRMALEAWRGRHQAYPQKLSELVPSVLPAVPLDPWSNQPFRYQRSAAGAYRFYSIGSDKRDQGGKGPNKFNPLSDNCTVPDDEVYSNIGMTGQPNCSDSGIR